jgi:hypothetical protein
MGIAIGSVIEPFSLGLWAGSYYIIPVGILTVMLGVASSLIHGMSGFRVAEWLGVSRNVSLV